MILYLNVVTACLYACPRYKALACVQCNTMAELVPQKSSAHQRFMYPILLKQAEYLRKNGQVHHNSNANDNVAVLVEPRDHVLLEAVIRNVIYFLNKTEKRWNLTIFCGTDNRSKIEQTLEGWSYRLICLGLPNIDTHMHNKLLRQKSFWNSFPEENVLVFQTDSCMLREGIEDYVKYDFIGAWVCNPMAHAPLKNKTFGGFNGGFSFRHRSSMLHCIDKVSLKDINNFRRRHERPPFPEDTSRLAEDIYFFHACSFLHKKLPDQTVANSFSTEAICNIGCLGIHAAFDKEFFPLSHLQELVRKSELNQFSN